MATKILRVFQEFTSEGYVPMPPAGNIDYGVTIAGTFPSTTPATFQTDITDIEVEVTEVTDFYVWIRSHGSEWNYQYTRNVRVYPDSPDINNVVMGIIIANLDNTVPYTGATENVDLGEFGIKAGYVGFDLTPTGTPTDVGTMVWNDQDGTLDLKLKGGNVTLQIGQEQLTRVVNKTGGDLLESNYQAVRISGAQGNRLKVALAQANNDANSAETLGIITETILNNEEGFITTSGLVRNINTTGSIQGETWTDGDMLYLSGTTAGRLTNIKPQAPTHTVIMGYVVRSHATQGQIYVKVDNGYELDELHNVKITSVAENDFLIYDATNSVWENRAILKTNGYLPYFDSTEIFKQSPIFTDGTNVTINSLDVITGGGTANYIPKLGTTKTLVNSLLYDNGTNVGIGSTNPQFKFEVRGGAMGVYASTSYYGKQEIANNDYMFTSGSGFYFRTNDATATVFAGRINNSGNWGIGILNPTQKLDVNGNINIPTGSNYLINGVQLDTDDIPQGSTNQYLTEAGLYPYMYNFASGEVKWNVVTHQFYMNQASSTTNGWLSNTDWNTFNNKENAITAGTTAQYWRGDKSWQTLNTSVVPEGTNLYYTDARSRSAISSSATGLTYTSGTGVFSLTAGYAIPTTSALGNYDTAYNRSLTAVAVSGTTTKTITLTKQDGTTLTASWSDLNTDAVTSVFGRTGAIVATSGDYTTSQVTESGNLYYTDARARASLSFTAGSGAYNSTTGVITIPTNTSQLTNGAGFITGITSGMVTTALGYTPVPTTRTLTINGTAYDLSADRSWTIAGTISGLTTNYIPKATSATTIGNSLIYDNGSGIGINTTSITGAFTLPLNTSNSQISTGSIEIQSYAVNNSWIGDNLYFNGTAFVARNTGYAHQIYFGTDSGIRFLTGNSSVSSNTSYNASEKMRIWGITGNVSIGNTNNTYKLDVSGQGKFSDGTQGLIIGAYANAGGYGAIYASTVTPGGSNYSLALSSTTTYVNAPNNGNVILASGGNGYLTLNSSGNLGLGVNPSAWSTGKAFEVSSSGNALWSYGQDNIYLLSNSYFNGGWKYGGNGYATNYTQYQGQHQWYNAPSNSSGAGSAISFTQAMTLDASGNLMVGTTTASYPASGRGNITIGGSSTSVLSFQNNGTDKGFLYHNGTNFEIYNSANGFLGFGTNGSEKMRINAGGNVSIGNTNNTYKLDVSGTGRFKGSSIELFVQHSDSNTLTLGNWDGSYQYIKSINLGVALTPIQIQATSFYFNGGAATFSSSITTTSTINSGSGVNNVTLNAGNLDFYNAGASNKFIRVADDASTINAIGFSKSGSTATTWFPSGNVGIGTTSPSAQLHIASGNFVLGANPSTQYKFNVQGLSGNYISYWTPTFSGADQNGIISHNGSGLGGLRPLGFTGTEFVFGNTVTGGGLVQVNGDVNISGTFRVNGTAIGTGGGGVSGSGTTNKVARWSSSTSLTNSLINDDGTNVSIYSGNASQWISITNSNLQLSEVSSSVGGVLDFKTGSPSLTTRVRIDSVGRFSLNTTSNPLYTNILHTILASSDSNYRTTISPVFGDNYSVFSYMGSANTGLFIGSGGTVASDTSILSFSNSSADSAINFCGHKFNTGYYLSLRVKWNTVQMPNLPTSSSGLSSGDIWRDGSGYLRIV